MLTLITVNLSSSFNDFITTAENRHLADTKKQLISLYQQQNSWQPIINNVQIWRDIVDPQSKRPPPPPESFRKANNNRGPKPRGDQPRPRANQLNKPPPRNNMVNKPRPSNANPSDILQTGKRLSLYDKNKNVIVGKRYLTDNPLTQTIVIDGEVVGWLGLKPSKLVENSPANEFLKEQYQSFYLIAAVTVVLAFIMALIFSKHLIAPIRLLISGTNRLIEGNYQNRIHKTTRDELGTLSDNVNTLAVTLENNQKNRYQWMSDTSHELRTPLTVLRAQLIAIQDGVFAIDEKKVQLFIDEIDNLSHLVNDLYQLSSADDGGLTYKKIKFNPISILLQVIENFTAKLELHSLTTDYLSLERLHEDDRCIVLADKERLRQLFTNLMENSCRYTHSPGKIIVSAHYDKHFLDIIIEDSAPGVANDAQQKLFERFYRVEQSRNRNYGGSGLGLSLCKQIVEAHQGTITALDSSLGGLSIKISIPIHNKLS